MEKKKHLKKHFMLALAFLVTFIWVAPNAIAAEFNVFGKSLRVMGYATQGGAFGWLDKSDTEKGLQQALMNIYLEGEYKIAPELKFYGSGLLTVDWAYQLKHNDSSWHDKLFDKSKDKLNVDDKYWQLLKEAHLTWRPGDFMFRVGKQIVSWGETDGFRLMDQINPLDQRRGLADVEFETTIIPIWLVRADYYPKVQLGWLQDLGFEFIFNPSPDFIPNQPIYTGNDVAGVWAPFVRMSGPFPFGEARLGSMNIKTINDPNHFDSDFFEYGFRIKGIVKDSIITLNYFYGRENSPVSRSAPIPPDITMASDWRLVLHPYYEWFFPRLHFLGTTFSRDITPLKASFLGGVAPVVRLEGLYAFNSTFGTTLNTFEKHDEVRWAIGIDWKVKIPLLNPRAYFMISPQFYHRKVMDYPNRYELIAPGWPPDPSATGETNSYMTTLLISTSYLHNKLNPSFFWMHDINNRADFFRLQLMYKYSEKWQFTLGAILLHGKEEQKSFEPLKHKDNVYFKVSYKWD